MQSREEILGKVQATLQDMFGFPADNVRPEAKLIEDLDIDSIDSLNLVIQLENVTGKKIHPAELRKIRTVQDVADALYILLNEP